MRDENARFCPEIHRLIEAIAVEQNENLKSQHYRNSVAVVKVDVIVALFNDHPEALKVANDRNPLSVWIST